MQCLNIVGKCSAFEAAPPSPENANYQQSSGVGFFTYLTAMRNGLLFGVYERQIRARATPAFFQFFPSKFHHVVAFGLTLVHTSHRKMSSFKSAGLWVTPTVDKKISGK